MHFWVSTKEVYFLLSDMDGQNRKLVDTYCGLLRTEKTILFKFYDPEIYLLLINTNNPSIHGKCFFWDISHFRAV
jgi:hypothetical protein